MCFLSSFPSWSSHDFCNLYACTPLHDNMHGIFHIWPIEEPCLALVEISSFVLFWLSVIPSELSICSLHHACFGTGDSLYDSAAKLRIPDLPAFALECLPNRNSLVYGDLYGIGSEASTIFRGTLRYEGMVYICSMFL